MDRRSAGTPQRAAGLGPVRHTSWARRRPSITVDQVAADHRYRARRFVYRARTADHPARSGWFVAIPVHIAGIIEREHVAATADRLLPRRTLLVHRGGRAQSGGAVRRGDGVDALLRSPRSSTSRGA
ncbi:hypothetical protein [Streptomyces hirsutus]|uniref:hypothetical protein n=1 Tax=Streptomyces hirsutus TaxID=35620 RepID=UPI00365ABD9A